MKAKPPAAPAQKITIEPISLGLVWLLDEIESPILKPGSDLSARQLCEAIFAFSAPADAFKASREKRFAEAAQQFTLAIPFPEMAEYSRLIRAAMDVANAAVAGIKKE